VTCRIVLAAFAVTAFGTVGTAEPPPLTDDVSKAYDAALTDFLAGKDKQTIVDRLKPAVANNRDSYYHKRAAEFLADLSAAAKTPPVPADAGPERRLAETRVYFCLLAYSENWEGSLKPYAKKEPTDPVCQLLAEDRTVIGKLLPLLDDRTPTRCADLGIRVNTSHLPVQPRVCDVALAIIEYHSLCRFHHDTVAGYELHQLPADKRETVAKRIGEWWEENRTKSVAAGVRAQFPHANYSAQIWMAKTLVRIGKEQKTDDEEFGLKALRTMVKQGRRGGGVYAANALAQFGDFSPVDVFYDEWKSVPELTHDPQITFYLCDHGKRREWELLHTISLEEKRDGKGPSGGAVWSCVVNSGTAKTNPYAIPILGLALDQTENTGSRTVENGTQSFSYADTATESFQKQVGKDFGYKSAGTAQERLAAIKKAGTWWEAEGKAKYTFDYIEKNLKPDNLRVKN
jgi:hypothetical protein